MSTKPITISMPPPVIPGGSEVEHEDHFRDSDLNEADEGLDVLSLVRERLELGSEVADVTIAASIAAIAARGDQRGRWLAAFGSPLGRWLASRGRDLNASLTALVALAQARGS